MHLALEFYNLRKHPCQLLFLFISYMLFYIGVKYRIVHFLGGASSIKISSAAFKDFCVVYDTIECKPPINTDAVGCEVIGVPSSYPSSPGNAAGNGVVVDVFCG